MRDKAFYFKNGPRAVLLFHAFSSTPNDVRSLGRALEREGYTVYAPTFSGHNTSHIEDVLMYAPSDWYNDAKEALAFLQQEGHTSIAAFGLSMGGVMAIRLLMEEQLIGGGTFASPMMSKNETNVPTHYWPYFDQQKKQEGYTEKDIDEMHVSLKPKLSTILLELKKTTQKMESSYAYIRCPIFIAQGGNDTMINPENAFQFAESLIHAKVELKWYEEGEHAITVGEYSKDVQEDMVLFLNRLDWDGGFE